MPRKRRNRNKFSKWLIIGLILFILLGLFALYRIKGLNWLESIWAGKEQITLAVEDRYNQDGYLLTLTPAKDMAVITRVPAQTVIETPWFGEYQVEKLPLLAEQEGKSEIYGKSLGYYLGIPVDFTLSNANLKLDEFNQSVIRKEITSLFFPPRSLFFGQVWRYLTKKDIVWEVIDLEDFVREDSLADGTRVLRINPSQIDQQFWQYFSDPAIKRESLTLSIFNVGGKEGLAKKISLMAENMGIRVVEVSDIDSDVKNCSILLSRSEGENTQTVKRLKRVLGCRLQTSNGEGIGDIQLLIKNVKIGN